MGTLQLLLLEQLFVDSLDPSSNAFEHLLLLTEFLVRQHSNGVLSGFLILAGTGKSVHSFVFGSIYSPLDDKLLQSLLVVIDPLDS